VVGLSHVRTPGEEQDFLELFRTSLPGPIRGNDVPDAHLVTLMRQHWVTSIYTIDRGFRRFEHIRVIDPFAGSS
jgi:predicted nucleic acid-binding protein